MKKDFLEFSTNKGEILNKKSSIVHLSKRVFKYQDQDPISTEPDPSRPEKFLENLNEILLGTQSGTRDSLAKKPDPPIFKCILSLMVIFFVCSGGFFGPFYLLVGANEFVRIFWRQAMTTILLVPIAFCERRMEVKHDISHEKLFKALILGVVHALWSLGFGLSVNSTSMMHVYLMNGLDVLFLSVFRAFTSSKMIRLEMLGVFGLGITIVLTLVDKAGPSGFGGDFLALAAGLVLACYSYSIEKYELNSPFWLCSLIISLFSSVLLMIIGGVCGGTWDLDENTGVFGLFTQKWFFIHIIISLSAGIFYFSFLNVLRKHYEETVIRVLLGLITFLGGFLNYFLGFEGIPSVLSLVAGGIAIVAGVLVLTAKRKSEGLEFELDKDESDEEKKESYYMEMRQRD